MSLDAEDYVARVLEQDPLPVVDTDASKWVAVHDALEPTALRAPPSSGPGSVFTVAWVLGIALGLTWVMRNGRTVFEQWQENVHRRANRRRHGIPDDDDRPFNVAYAAAALERRQRDEQNKKHVENARPEPTQLDSEWARHGEGLRQRPLLSAGQGQGPFENAQLLQGSSMIPLASNGAQFMPEESNTHRTQFRPQPPRDSRMVQSYDWRDRHQPGVDMSRPADRPDPLQPPLRSSSVDPSSRRHLDVDGTDSIPAERRKHHELDDSDDEDRLLKKSRVAVDGGTDGDNDAAWANMPGGSRRGSLQVLKRGSKRHANAEADDDWEMSRDKRARKGSGAHTSGAEEAHDVDMAHDASDADAEPARGTKRDREDAESVADGTSNDAEDSPRLQPARKRRANRQDESLSQGLPSRGRKRDRSHQRSIPSDEEGEESDTRATRHKRGRRLEERQESEEDAGIVTADASESEAEISLDPNCGGRRAGETWESNSQSFKVGLDGRRLRHALIRQSRTRFSMPGDSSHRDAKTNVEVIVEKWLNDDEYKAAKENYELAWQDASPVSTPEKAQAPTRHEEPPSSGGKRLLWGGPPPSPVKGRSSLRSASSVQNPFDLAPNNAGRRIASAQMLLNSQIESPKLRNSKSFSKWEKQDLEALSLKKMRARMEKQKAEAAAVAAAKAPAPAPAPAPTPLASTTNTQSQPPTQSSSDPKKPTFPSLSAVTTTPASSPSAKPASGTPAASNPGFSLGKPASTPSGTGAQPSGALALNAGPQPSTASPAQTAQIAPKPSFSFSSTPGSGTTPSKPSFSFPTLGAAPPSSSTQNAPLTTTASFSFPTPGAAPPSSSTQNAPLTTPTPSLPFGPSSTGASKNEPLKSPFGSSPGLTPSSEPGKGGIPNFFAKPASQAPSVSTPTSATGGALGVNSGPQSAQNNPPAKSSFSFGQTGGQSNPTAAKSSFSFGQPGGQNNPAPAKSSFSFGQPGGQSNPAAAKSSFSFSQTGGQSNPVPSSGGGGGSLLSRLGPTTSTSQVPQSNSEQKSWSSPMGGGQPAPQPTSASSPFGNPFGQPAPSSQPQSQPQSVSSNPFGQQQSTTSKPPLFGASGSGFDAAKSNPFGQPSTTTGGTGSGASSGFGTMKSNPFGQPSTTKGDAGSAFSLPKLSGQTGAPAQSATPAFSFPKPTTQPTQTPQAKPQLAFNFGGSTTPTNSPQTAPTNAFKPATSAFPPPSTGAQPQGGFSFSFGNQPSSSNTNTNTNTNPNPSPFGFGFGSKPADTDKK